jgi:heavy metal sensor kinase
MPMPKSFRLRLTAWYLFLFTVVFVAFSLFLYGLVSHGLYSRLDDNLSSQAQTAAGMFRDELGESHGDAASAAREVIADLKLSNVLVAVFEGGKPLAASVPVDNRELLDLAGRAASGESDIRATVSRVGKVRTSRLVAHPFAIDGRHFVMLAGESLHATREELELLRGVLYVALPLALLIAGAGGFFLATRSLAPLRWMAEQAKTITDKNLNQRLDIGAAHEELRVLADSFNELLSRLDQSFETMRRFVADASHELRTPLSVIRGEADVALGQDRSAGEYQESLVIIQDEARRLTRLVDDLLNLARADAGHVNLRTEEFYLNELLAECCRAFQTVATAKQVDLQCMCPGDVAFRGDPELIRRLVLNLIDNAVRHTPAGGRVLVDLEAAANELRIQVADSGIGIPPEAAPHVFERFYRGDQARSRQDGGFGLGLAIVKWIAESHQGAVDFTSEPGAGTTFTVLLHR